MEMQYDDRRSGAAEVLIVDDHPEITAMVAEALSDEGYHVRIAHDGVSALHEIERCRPDLLLLDVAMPLMSGDQVLTQLREQGHRDLPVILMTADRTPERFRALGADQLLRKPFDLRRLLQLVAHFTSKLQLGGRGEWLSFERKAGY